MPSKFKLKVLMYSKLLLILAHLIELTPPQHNKYSFSIEFFNIQFWLFALLDSKEIIDSCE